jgi:polar amino acid transport system permease protein
VTLEATLGGMALALVLGLVWALLRRSRRAWLAWPVAGLVEFVRSTPLLVQLLFCYYGLPALGVRLPVFALGVIALGVHYSAYTAEVYRSGIDGVPKGQWEAARALDLGHAATWRHVILPQAVPPVVPVLGNYLVAMFKETAILSSITVLEVMRRARMIADEGFRAIEPYTLVGALYLAASLLAGLGVRYLERTWRVAR